MVRSRACVSAIRSSALSRVGIRDAREVCAGRHLLADVDGHLFEHPVHAGAHLQAIHLVAPECHQRLQLIDASLLGLELGPDVVLGDFDALLLEAIARGQ